MRSLCRVENRSHPRMEIFVQSGLTCEFPPARTNFERVKFGLQPNNFLYFTKNSRQTYKLLILISYTVRI